MHSIHVEAAASNVPSAGPEDPGSRPCDPPVSASPAAALPVTTPPPGSRTPAPHNAEAPPSPPSSWNKTNLSSLRVVVCEDRATHGSWLLPGTQAVAVHRLGEWMLSPNRSRLGKAISSIAYRFAYAYLRNLLGIEIPPTVRLGRGVHIAHQHGIAFHPYTTVGDRTKIHHMVTIGLRDDRDTASGPEPRIGSDVLIGVGATILGGVSIGDGATIGPHAVVTKDVPAGATVVAAPSRTLRLR